MFNTFRRPAVVKERLGQSESDRSGARPAERGRNEPVSSLITLVGRRKNLRLQGAPPSLASATRRRCTSLPDLPLSGSTGSRARKPELPFTIGPRTFEGRWCRITVLAFVCIVVSWKVGRAAGPA